MPARTILRLLAELVAPTACAACDLPGAALCAACRASLVAPAPPACAACGHPAAVALATCAHCPGAGLRAAHAAAYAGALPALLHALKERGRADVARPLAALVLERVPAPPAGSVLVPVPLGARRLRERGYNQAEVLARALGEAWGLPVRAALARAGDGPRQRGAGRDTRARQVARAFRAAEGAEAVPERCVLIDDVHTTGATLTACARALRRSGATDLAAVTVARVWWGYPPPVITIPPSRAATSRRSSDAAPGHRQEPSRHRCAPGARRA